MNPQYTWGIMWFLWGTIYVVDIAYLQNIHYIIMAQNSSSSSKNAISNMKISDHSLFWRLYRRNFGIKILNSILLTPYFKIFRITNLAVKIFIQHKNYLNLYIFWSTRPWWKITNEAEIPVLKFIFMNCVSTENLETLP